MNEWHGHLGEFQRIFPFGGYFYQYNKKKQRKLGILYDIQVGINLQQTQKYVPKGIQNKTFILRKGP